MLTHLRLKVKSRFYRRKLFKLRSKAFHYFSLGKWGERRATRHLIKNGYYIRHVNWRCKQGELDIIAQNESNLVYIEVKTRQKYKEGKLEFSGLEAVDDQKIQKLLQLSRIYRRKFGLELKYKRLRHDKFEIVTIDLGKFWILGFNICIKKHTQVIAVDKYDACYNNKH